MKKLFTLLLLLSMFITAYTQSLGTWQSKGSGITAANRSMQGVSAVDSNIVWAITYDPTGASTSNEFTRTVDGGATWISGTVTLPGEEFFILDIFALNKDTAWVGGGSGDPQSKGGLYKTMNGGETWVKQTGVFNQAGHYIIAVHFFNAQDGIAYGGTRSFAKIWTTDDGGDTWIEIPSSNLPFRSPPVIATEPLSMHYGTGHYDVVGDTIWFGSGSQRIWRSVDRGKTWNAFDVTNRTGAAVVSVAFKNAQSGIALTDRGGYQTDDGGQTWVALTNLPRSNIAYYQIEHIPGTNGAYYLTYEGSEQYYNDIRHVYSLNNGQNWILMPDPGIECVEFVSPTKAWGGGVFTNPTQGGMYQWTGNIPVLSTPDHAAAGIADKLSLYTINTLKQQKPIKWRHILSNTGRLPLTDITLYFKVTKDGSTEQFQKTIDSIPKGETTAFEFEYLPAEIGKYTFSVTASNTQLGADFYKSLVGNYEVNDSIVAKDDGIRETQLGFGFGNPRWYGYYGSAFELTAPDTLTAISVNISRFSQFSNLSSSINLTVNAFDSTERPNIELFHSPKIILRDSGITATNNKLTYHLEAPLVLPAGRYVFAAGQDTLQGIIGFDFDITNTSEDGFWLVSPIAGGGYPWAHAIRREAMMIRPHFNTKTATTATNKIKDITTQINLYPNPFTTQALLEFELKDNTLPVEIVVSDVLGRTIKSWNLETPNAGMNQVPLTIDAPSGLLLLTLRQGNGVKTIKMIKR